MHLNVQIKRTICFFFSLSFLGVPIQSHIRAFQSIRFNNDLVSIQFLSKVDKLFVKLGLINQTSNKRYLYIITVVYYCFHIYTANVFFFYVYAIYSFFCYYVFVEYDAIHKPSIYVYQITRIQNLYRLLSHISFLHSY